MPSNRFGRTFCFTTWGESHGKAIGVVIDGCPAGLEICEEDINAELDKRAPGKSPYTSPRKEPDRVEILSGLFEGKTTGAPISLLIANCDADSSKYEPIKHLIRPGHANATYLAKYGIFDYRGGGRASARETAARVAAGAVAKKLLDCTFSSRLVSPDMEAVEKAMEEGSSVGGIVEARAENVPIGLGDPIYHKLDAELAHAMLSIPATKGFEIGSGFSCGRDAGGILGGISTGEPIVCRVAFKPTSSTKKLQETVDLNGNPAILKLPEGSRHDPCVAIRGAVVVESMLALVLADAFLSARLHQKISTEYKQPL